MKNNKLLLTTKTFTIVLLLVGLIAGCAEVDHKKIEDTLLARIPAAEEPLVEEKVIETLQEEPLEDRDAAAHVQEPAETVALTQPAEEEEPPAQFPTEEQAPEPEAVEGRPAPMTVSKIMEEKREPVETFSFATKDANIKDVLVAISKSSNVNIIVDPEIEGSVTVDLKDVTLEQVLNQLLPQYGLGYKKEGNMVRVFKPGEMTVSEIMDENMQPVEQFSFSVEDADIKTVLLDISKKSKVNVIVEPDVSGPVTVDMNDVTLEQILEQLLPQYKLDYKKDGNLVRVFKHKLEMETRVFTLNYIPTKRIGTRTVTASTGAITQTGGGESGGAQGTTGGGGEEEAAAAASYSKLIDSDTADIWDDIQDGLEAIVFGRPEYAIKTVRLPDLDTDLQRRITSRGGLIEEKTNSGKKLLINKMSSTIMVTDNVENLNRVAEFLEAIENSILRQVVINAKIIEVTLSDEYHMGIDWEFIQEELRLAGFFAKVEGSKLGKPFGFVTLGQEITEIDVSPGSTKVTYSGSKTVSEIIDALSKQGKVRVLSSPRVATLNNQKAIIKVARQDVFFTKLGVSGGTIGGASEASQIPSTVDIGILLDVLPQIGSDGMLTMSIHPSISVKVEDVVNPGGGTFPIVDIRETDTTVRMADGQTAIIGGLMREAVDEQENGIPGLKSIPLLGRFFSHTEIIKEHRELVIMLTPTILVDKSVEELTDEERDRLEL